MSRQFATPETLFALIRQDEYPGHTAHSGCSHYFIQSQQNGTTDVQFICERCFLHLTMDPIASQLSSNPNCQKHFYHYRISDQKDSSLMRAECLSCNVGWIVRLKERVLDQGLIAEFINSSELSNQINCLLMAIFYCGNILHGAKKPINSDNPKFRQFIGVKPSSLELLSQIGYSFTGSYFEPMENFDMVKSLYILEELSLQMQLISSGSNSSSIYTFLDATERICTSLGISMGKSKSMKEFIDIFQLYISKTTFGHARIGCTSNCDAHCLISHYKLVSSRYPEVKPKWIDSFIEIANAISSSALEEFIAMERSKGVITESELSTAYHTLGNSITEESTPERILDIYTMLVSKEPERKHELKEALRILASHRDCYKLEKFLLDDSLPSIPIELGTPIGLNNIGNTCYLNLILQYFFSLTLFREEILDYCLDEKGYAQYLQGHTNDQLKAKAMESSKALVFELKSLFHQLVYNDGVAISPERRLAELILTNAAGNSFGEQQDFHECIDNMIDILDNASLVQCKKSQLESGRKGFVILERLFFGKMKHTLLTQDLNGNEKKLVKVEDFYELIVEVQSSLMDSLTLYFNNQTVEFEHSSASKRVSIMQFPPILTIRINRVKFDRATMQTIKCNDFLAYPKKINLHRFSSEEEDARDEKKIILDQLDSEIANCRTQLSILHGSNTYPESPVNMLRAVANLISAEDGGTENETLYHMLQETIQDILIKTNAFEAKIVQIEHEKNNLYASPSSLDYHLYGVFMHEGAANFGHYSQYLYNWENQQWLKYNDSQVSYVPEEVVFQDTTGKTFNAFSLIYVKSEELKTLTSPVARSELFRQKYQRTI